MADLTAPADVIALAEERALARAERDFRRADELRARIEAAGWGVIDDGPAFSLHATRVADVVREGQTVYGAVESVPTQPTDPSLRASVVLLGAGAEGPTILDALAGHTPETTEIVAVVPESAGDLAAHTVLRTVESWTMADTLRAGVATARGPLVVVLDGSVVPIGDVVGPLLAALDDPAVAVAGGAGLWSSDLHRFSPADRVDVTAVGPGCYAFRREDLLAREPVDTRLRTALGVATWLSLTLRDAGPDEPPRRAVRVELPLSPAPGPDDDDPKVARRDGYRVSDRFRARAWLAGEEPAHGHGVGDGADEHDDDHDPDQPGHAGEA